MIAAGHQVRGLTRSDEVAEQLRAAGAEVHHGNLTDLNGLRRRATGADVVVNLAFSHDFANFAKNAEALGSALKPVKLLVVTSGTGLASGGLGHVAQEE